MIYSPKFCVPQKYQLGALSKRGRKGNETNFPQSIYMCVCSVSRGMQARCNPEHLKSQLLLIAPGLGCIYKHVPKRFKYFLLVSAKNGHLSPGTAVFQFITQQGYY